MKESPFVSIVVASYNRKYIIKENIQSLIALDYPNESYEIVLIDNYSMDGTIEEVNRHFSEYIDSGFLKVVPLPYNSGSSGSYVEALNFMNPDWEYMLKMDEDLILDSNCLKSLVKQAVKSEKNAVIGNNNQYNSIRLHKIISNTIEKTEIVVASVVKSDTCNAKRAEFLFFNRISPPRCLKSFSVYKLGLSTIEIM